MDAVRGRLVASGRGGPGRWRPYVYRGTQPIDGPGLCVCGCGEPAKIAAKTDRRTGAVRGKPLRFADGHHNRAPRGKRAA